MTEILACDPNCPCFTFDTSSWTYEGSKAVCVGGDNGKSTIGRVPFINKKNSNTPDRSYVPMLRCVNTEARKRILSSAK